MVRLVVLCSWHLRLRLFCFVMCVFVSCRRCCKLFGFFVVYTLFADDVADDEQVGHDCFGYVVAGEVGGGAVCDVGVVVDLFVLCVGRVVLAEVFSNRSTSLRGSRRRYRCQFAMVEMCLVGIFLPICFLELQEFFSP